MTDLCCICDKPKPPKARGRTCGSRVCRGKLAGQKPTTPYPEYEAHWPRITGEVTADFSPHEAAARDGGYGLKIVRADERSYIGCSADVR